MSIELRLNPEALAAMFPEGTEARVELQKAVVFEFVKRNLRVASLGPEVERAIRDAMNDSQRISKGVVEQAQAAVLGELGLKKAGAWGDTYELQPGARNEVYVKVKAAFDERVNETITSCIDRRMRKLEAEIETEVQKRLDAIVEVLTVDVVRAKLETALKGLVMIP